MFFINSYLTKSLIIKTKLHTFSLLLDLQGDRLSCLLQQTDGFAQRFPFQAAAVYGQDTISHMDRTGPAAHNNTDNVHTLQPLSLQSVF